MQEFQFGFPNSFVYFVYSVRTDHLQQWDGGSCTNRLMSRCPGGEVTGAIIKELVMRADVDCVTVRVVVFGTYNKSDRNRKLTANTDTTHHNSVY